MRASSAILFVVTSILAMGSLVAAATSFSGLPPASITPGSPISGSYNTNGNFVDGDWIGLFQQNQTCCPGACGDCNVQWQYLTGATGSITFTGDSTRTFASATLVLLHIRDNANGSVILGSSSVISVRASATLSPKAPIIAGQAAFVPYTADASHSLSDWIGLYEVGSDTYDQFVYVTEGPTGTAILPVPIGLAGKQIEFRYIFWYGDAVITVSAPVTVQGVQGKCAAECSNSGTACDALGDGSECTSCTGSETCVPPATPQYLDTTLEENSNFVINVGQPWNTTVYVNTTGVTCTNWKFYLDGPAKMTTSGTFNSTRLSWQPTEAESNNDYRACFSLRCEDNGFATDQRCFSPFVRSSSCSAWGDPHFSTFDGRSYDYMGIGDYVLMKSKNDSSLNAQVRYALCFPGEYDGPTCVTALALRYFTDQIVMYWQSCTPQLYINNQLQNPNSNLTFGGGTFSRLSDLEGVVDLGYEIAIGDFVATVTLAASGAENYCFGNVVLRPTRYLFDGVVGMCGSWDSNADNDLAMPNGTLAVTEDAFGNSWRLLESDSFFNYTMVGLNYTQVNNFTKTSPTITWTSPDLEQAAQDLCASVASDKASQNACLYDVAFSGNLSYAKLTAAKSVVECTAETNGDISSCNPNTRCAALKYCNYHGNCTQSATCACSKGFTGSMCETAVALSSASILSLVGAMWIFVIVSVVLLLA